MLRGLLGLTEYYRRFIKGYSLIATHMTDLLRKNNFHWGEEATNSFEKLKTTMVSTPVLMFPDFGLEFTVETDACKSGVGVVP